MKHTWIQQNNSNKLLVFFNGWGCDEHQFMHLKSLQYDVMMVYDYRNILPEDEMLMQIKKYPDVNIAAWSYGVWMAQYTFEKYHMPYNTAIAINGTSRPVHDRYGIAESIVQGTLDHLSERNVMKFQRRMVGGNEAWKKFEADKPRRSFEEQKEELASLITHFKKNVSDAAFYQKAIIGTKDLIFTSLNQSEFWKEKTELVEIDAPHFCFYGYNSWDEIMEVN